MCAPNGRALQRAAIALDSGSPRETIEVEAGQPPADAADSVKAPVCIGGCCMSTTTSKCYRLPGGFLDGTDYVEVFSDGTSICHQRNGQPSKRLAHIFQRPIKNGEWVEIENPVIAGDAA